MAKNQQYKNNPSGIIFGKNASLDVSGSFVASTANAMLFGNLSLPYHEVKKFAIAFTAFL
ncbi:hypothetical protein [Nostoc sp. 106C]|uniref:two-partner secretion domain-containing protein n=1 Tax=Nostoc sp. 106C TaxID=1932667 RepID=UPI000A3733D0|nr:hypothetical protein [Nostoc sp. 106C]OUL28249.1 hypothetical protein BV375_18765 [Nostoc sp. 106C]